MFQRISVFAAALLAVVLVMPIAAHAQLAPPRTLAELKAEIQLRADHPPAGATTLIVSLGIINSVCA